MSLDSLNPTGRFSSRADNYAKYRPGYPAAVLDLLRRECRLTPDSVVADIGAGTGILTSLLLSNGNVVFAVEPNREMREQAERLLGWETGFLSVPGTAEATTLPAGKFDLIIAGQAFHWFEPTKARAEFARILKPGGWVVLVWNEREAGGDGFARAYENLLTTNAPDYSPGRSHYAHAEKIQSFFAPAQFKQASFPNAQSMDFEALKGRLLSSSYTPEAGDPKFEPMLEALQQLFETHQKDGRVAFQYETLVFYGQLSVPA